MKPWLIALIVIIVILLAAVVALYFLGRKLEKKKEESDRQMEAISQTIPMLVIDKKKMRLKEAGLPQIVYEQTPKLLRRQKVPIVKAKVGPKIQVFMCDAAIFDEIPIKKEVRATVSGLYITGVKGMRKPLEKPEPKKKKLTQRLQEKARQLQAETKQEETASGKKSKKK